MNLTCTQIKKRIENLEACNMTRASKDKCILYVLRELLKDKEGRNIPEETKQKIREFILDKESKDEF